MTALFSNGDTSSMSWSLASVAALALHASLGSMMYFGGYTGDARSTRCNTTNLI